LAIALLAGQASAAAFVDTGLPDLKPEQMVVVPHPQPVQLLVEFRTKGVANAKATQFVKQQVIDTVKASKLFSDVAEAPTTNGALLDVIIDDVVVPEEMHDAEAKGFATGATFFIAGSTVREHYTCEIDYVGGPNAPKLTRTANHSILIQLGLINSPPPNAVKVEGGTRAAVMMMVRQIVSNPLNALASDPGFQPGDGVPVATPVPPVASTAVGDAPASDKSATPAETSAAQPQAAPAHP
jgi:hypothetical protein